MEQLPLVTFEGRPPKRRLGLLSARWICRAALAMPLGLRLAFTFAINFVYNHAADTARLAASLAMRQAARLLILLTYYGVLGPVSLAARLGGLGRPEPPDADSFFLDKEPADAGEGRFLRQY